MKKLTFSWIVSPQQLVRVILGCIILSGSLVFSSGAFALTLEQAKQQGRVGETLSGYLAPVKKDAETLALVEQINIARAEKYQEVAQKNHISTEDVAKLAGQKLVNRAAAGEYVRGINGQWMQR
ncbi:TPA: YdbL family protein [Yersinia enterocolitica]|nr:YdbL family protein [Yersinia enterocolitica]